MPLACSASSISASSDCDEHDLGRGVGKHVGIVGGTQERVAGDHDRADPRRAEEAEKEGVPVPRRQHHPVALFDAERAKNVGHSLDAFM